MSKIQIKNIDGDVIFEYKKKNNTIKDTLEVAIKNGVSLANADLKGADLRGADLRFAADLYGANISDANLSGANISSVNISYANLKGSDLSYANLKGAGLCGAYLSYANLSNADLSDANLICTNLSCANLKGASLRFANLYCTNLSCANLKGVDISDADLSDADLYGAKNIPDSIQIVCPKSGSFIAWKKIKYLHDEYLVKLEIPDDAKRSSAHTNKCRCSKAKVLEITNIETNESVNEVTNHNYTACIYRVGEMVYPDSFDNNRWNECSHGIHFFMDKQDALCYYWK